ncbi:SDR family NAD(P)-dependent oxidoreductase, partial [Nocardia sp. NPDC046473]|uniref:SDR family NAD(P)-dependent oxidoreductase n=1 Tax=Nocardia sp. NPDC046473 TaxID=3155733 RepID=UPI0033D342BA
AVPALRADRDEPEALLSAVAELFVSGREIDWVSVLDTMGVRGRRIVLPTYAFQRKRYWLPPGPGPSAAVGTEERFWEIVEDGDVDELMDTLGPAAADLTPQQWEPVLPALNSWRRTQHERTMADGRRYRIAWKPRTATPASRLSGSWLVVASGTGGVSAAVVETLRAHGAQVVVIDGSAIGEPLDRAAWSSALADLAGMGDDLAGVVSLLGLDDRPHPRHRPVPVGCADTLALVQALGDQHIKAPLWCLTRGAVSVTSSDAVGHPAQAMVWGLGRVVALEHPQRWGGLIDLPAAIDASSGDHLCAILADCAGEDQLAIRSSGTFLRRLVPAPATVAGPEWTPSGTVLITGGTGALGAHTARWIAGHGTARILLLSRGGPEAPGASALVAELAAMGTPAEVVTCDVTDCAAIVRVLDDISADHPLSAVVHTAGVNEDTAVAELDPAMFSRIVHAKVTGAQVLHEVLAERGRAELLILFSSVAGVWGGGGQGAYAAGNAFLDALAEHRRDLGLPTTALAWGPWAGGGMVDAESGSALDRLGLHSLSPGEATAELRHALGRGVTTLTVADADWSRFYPTFALARPRPLLHDLPGVAAVLAEPVRQGKHPAAELLARLPEAERRRQILELIRTCAAATLGHTEPAEIDTARGFLDLGFDSITAIEFRNQVGKNTGLELPPTILFDFPTVTLLAESIAQRISAEESTFPAALAAFENALRNEPITDRIRQLIDQRIGSLLLSPESAKNSSDAVARSFDGLTPDEMYKLIDDALGTDPLDAPGPDGGEL